MSMNLTTASTRRYLPRTAALEGAVLAALRSGYSISDAVRLVGVARSTIRNWRRDDPEFAEAFEKARVEGVENILRDRLGKA